MADERAALNAGIVVCLNSGGPRMTIIGTHEGTKALLCNWFVDDELRVNAFPPQAVHVVEDD